MKSVLISIRPEWCDKIASGEKTIEIRKNKPTIELPFKCYIYETKAINRKKIIVDLDGELPTTYARGRGKVIGEFICDRIEEFESEFYSSDNVLNAIYRVVEDEDYPGERIYTSIATNEEDSENFWICSLSCLSFEEIKKYIGYAKREIAFYGWHITNFKLYLSPKALDEFSKYWDYDVHDKRPCESCEYHQFDYSENMMVCGYDFDGEGCPKMNLTRPPQSWCYVMEQENNE